MENKNKENENKTILEDLYYDDLQTMMTLMTMMTKMTMMTCTMKTCT